MGAVLHIGAAANGADVLAVAAAVHAHHQHVDVVVAVGAGEGRLVQLGQGQLLDGLPAVLNIPGGAEQLGAAALNPLVDVVAAPVAGGE